MKCITMQADGSRYMRDIPEDVSIIQDTVSGYIESLLLRNESGNAVMLMNEEGKLLGLPVNVEASILAVRYGGISDTNDWICGAVMLYGAPDDEGNLTEVPQWLRDLLRL